MQVFGGERLGRCVIAEIQETVQFLPALSRSELVCIVCRQLGWHAPDGATATGVGSGLRVLGALARRCMVRLSPKPLRLNGRGASQPPLRPNFSHSLGAVERELEAPLLQAPQLRDKLNRVFGHTARGPQRERLGRSYPRRSRRPSKKWRNRKPADPPPQTESHLFAANHAVLKRMPLAGHPPGEHRILGSHCPSAPLRTPAPRALGFKRPFRQPRGTPRYPSSKQSGARWPISAFVAPPRSHCIPCCNFLYCSQSFLP